MITYKELLSKVKLMESEEKNNAGKYTFEPLPVGFGQTLGSVLRRVLLSSIPGAAVTHLKIEGPTHVFTTIPGVREDMVELILNIKNIRLKIFNDQPVILKLAAAGPGEVKASQLEILGEGELVSKDLVLANLADKKSKIAMELTAEPGVGYETAEDHPSNKIGVIPVDSVFTPVVNVSYRVEQSRVGRDTNLDSLVLEIQTDGTINPREALKRSFSVLVGFFSAFSDGVVESQRLAGGSNKEKEETSLKARVNEKEASVSLEDLGLSTRATNALLRAKIKTLGELLAKRESLSKVKGLGQKGLAEIGELLEKQGWN